MVEEDIKITIQPWKTYNGKYRGWIYQFLDENFVALHQPVGCKDYLQDIVYTELTKNTVKVFGVTTKFKGFINDKESLKLCLFYNSNGSNQTNEVITPTKLPDGIEVNLQDFLNTFEASMNFKQSEVTRVEDYLIVDFSVEWIKYPHLFSLFTLLCRMGGQFKDIDVLEYLNKEVIDFPLDMYDFYQLRKDLVPYKYLVYLLEGGEVYGEYTWDNILTRDYDLQGKNETIHESGIMKMCNQSVKFKEFINQVTNDKKSS